MEKTAKRLIISSLLALISIFGSQLSWGYEKEIKALSSSLAENIVASGKRSVAVVDFTDLQGNVTELGRFLAEEFSVSLSELGKGLQVVDRTHLKTLLKEHQLAMTGLIDPKTARKVGEIAGVHVLITGTITPFGDSVRLAVKALDTSTAIVFGASRGDIAKTKGIEELLAKGVESPSAVSAQQSPAIQPPARSGANSKSVGNIIATAKSITISREKVNLALDFYNKTDKEFKMAINQDARPNLVDERGNRFENPSGVVLINPAIIDRWLPSCLTLYPKSNNDFVLSFNPTRYLELKDIGSNFEASVGFILSDPNGRLISTHQVSFSNLKAQSPR